MKIRLVFDDWKKDGKVIYGTEEAIDLSLSDLHGGTIFDAEIQLGEHEKNKLKQALKKGILPFFYIIE